MTRIDLVVPTHSGGALLEACLRSLSESDEQGFNLFVVDDAAHVPVEATVRAHFPDAMVLRFDRNVGLAHGFNAAIDAGAGEFVVLLNDDTEVDPRWLSELVVCAEEHPEAGSIASKIRLLPDRERLHSAGDYFSVRGMPGNRGVWMPDVGQYDADRTVFASCGGAALYRRSALDAVRRSDGNVFNEQFFMYLEDVDLGWRLQRHGFGCVFAPSAVVYHHLSATGGGTLASYYVARNIWLLLAESIPRGVLHPYRARVLAYHGGRLVRALRHAREPAARATLRGTLAGIVLGALRARHAPRVSSGEVHRLQKLLWPNCA